MPEVHLPHLDEDGEPDNTGSQPSPTPPPLPAPSTSTHIARGRSLFRVALEVVLIAMGVFLGLAGEQWRENAAHREQAQASLRRFRAEIQANRDAVARVKDYHAVTHERLKAYLDTDPGKRSTGNLHIQGIQSVSFERAAWDLALATQSLAYIDPDLVFALSRVYTQQQFYSTLTLGVTQAMYLQAPLARGAVDPFLPALAVYYDDLVLIEPALLKLYDDVLGQLDKELGKSS